MGFLLIRIAVGFNLSDNIAALAEKLHSQTLQKLADVAFTVHQNTWC